MAQGFRQIASGAIGSFRYDPRTDRYEWDDQTLRMLEGQVGPHSTYADVLANIAPRARKEYDEWRMQAVTAGHAGAARIPFMLKDREIVLEITFRRIKEGVEGLLLDVTEDEVRMEALRNQHIVTEFAERLVRFGTWAYDIRRDAFRASRGAVDLLAPGADPSRFTFDKAVSLADPLDHAKLREAHDRSLRTGQPQLVEFRLAGKDEWRMIQFMRMLDEEGRPAFTCGMVHDTTTIHVQESRRQDYEELQEVRARLVNAAAHELSQPLTPMLMELELLSERLPKDQDVARAFRTIRSNVDRLHFMLNDLLDAARAQAGRLQVSVHDVDARPALESVLATMAALAGERDVRLRWDRPGPLAVRTDPMRLEQCLSNLVHNAIKFTAAGSVVSVQTAHKDGRVRIGVRDEGPGLSQDDKLRLFLPFEQIHPSPRGFVSTGLGLYITKLLMDTMGGTVEVDSAPGEGSTFWLVFPPTA